MPGISRTTGAIISDRENMAQKLQDILTTEKGERVLRGDYHSIIFDFVDGPGNEVTIQKLRAVVVDTVKRCEPGISIGSVKITASDNGHFIDIHNRNDNSQIGFTVGERGALS